MLLVSLAARAELTPELADIAARLDYGYYTDSPEVLAAAHEALRRMPDSVTVRYYRALASFRSAQLKPAEAALKSCLAESEAITDEDEAAVEAWVLVAACSTLATQVEPLKAILHQRRREQALEIARSIEGENPRLAWVASWTEKYASSPQGVVLLVRERTVLEQVVAAFRASPSFDGPSWGEAEALAHLGAAYLDTGDRRRARDLLEEALLVAPDYSLALKLLVKLKAGS